MSLYTYSRPLRSDGLYSQLADVDTSGATLMDVVTAALPGKIYSVRHIDATSVEFDFDTTLSSTEATTLSDTVAGYLPMSPI